MNIWKVILVTVVIFGTGVITGGLLGRRTHSAGTDNSSRHSGTNHTGQGFRPEKASRMDFVTRATEELNLTQEQREKIEVIVRESQVRTRACWEQVSPQIKAEFRATQEKILAVLTDPQRKKFEEIMKDMKERHSAKKEARTPP